MICKTKKQAEITSLAIVPRMNRSGLGLEERDVGSWFAGITMIDR